MSDGSRLGPSIRPSTPQPHSSRLIGYQRPAAALWSDQSKSCDWQLDGVGNWSWNAARSASGAVTDEMRYDTSFNEYYQSAASPGATPWLHLRMDDNAENSTVKDAAGSADQTFVDSLNPNTSAHTTPGKLRTALNFDGVDDHIWMPNADWKNAFTANWAMAFWVKQQDITDGNIKYLIFNRATLDGGGYLGTRIMYTGTGTLQGTFYLGATYGYKNVGSVTAADDGQWRHIVMQRNGTTLEFWVNGVRIAYNTATGNNTSMACDYPDLKTGGTGTTGHCNCSIDDFRLYNRALSQDQIKSLAQTGGGTAQTHTANGELESDGDLTYKWDAFGRLREVRDGGTLVESYCYDALSRRVRKYDPGETWPYTEYHYDGWRVVEERIENGGTWSPLARRQFTYGQYIDEPITLDTDTDSDNDCIDSGGSTRYYYLQDALYSVVAPKRGADSPPPTATSPRPTPMTPTAATSSSPTATPTAGSSSTPPTPAPPSAPRPAATPTPSPAAATTPQPASTTTDTDTTTPTEGGSSAEIPSATKPGSTSMPTA